MKGPRPTPAERGIPPLGLLIRAHMEARGLSLRALAEEWEMGGHNYLGRIVNGQADPSLTYTAGLLRRMGKRWADLDDDAGRGRGGRR